MITVIKHGTRTDGKNSWLLLQRVGDWGEIDSAIMSISNEKYEELKEEGFDNPIQMPKTVQEKLDWKC